jgi:hypothetical protein
MKTIFYLIGLCVVLLLIANSQSASAHFCVGKQNGCLVLGPEGIHLVSNEEAKKLTTENPP